MTKKSSERFGYIKTLGAAADTQTKQQAETDGNRVDELQTVPKGQGRMEQDRTQLNMRLPTLLKRRASAKATLEGRSLGDIIEEFLRSYVNDA